MSGSHLEGIAMARRLVRFGRDLVGGGVPEAVRDAVPSFLLDYLGNAIGGSTTHSARAVRRFLDSQGLHGRATAWGAGARPAQYAALANGVAAHSLESDDTHQPSSLHPGATVFSTALAALEEIGPDRNSASRFVPAVAAGYEVVCRVGMALRPADQYDRGFHPTATAGVFGAVMTAGLIFDLDEESLVSGLGIGGSMSAGLMEFLVDGTWTKRLHPGWAAHAGILAARLAQAGYTGPATVFEGPHGFLRAYAPHPDAELLTTCLGQEFQLPRTSIKAHACCRYKQAPIDGILQLMQAHGLHERDIREVTIGVLSAGWDIIVTPEDQKRNPQSVVDAQFSMPYGAAVALVRGRASPDEYTPSAIDHPGVRRVMEKVICRRDSALDTEYPARWPATIAIMTQDGRRLFTRVDYPKGDPENPLSSAELVAKVTTLTRDRLTAAEQVQIADTARRCYEPAGVVELLETLQCTNLRLSDTVLE